MVLNSVCTYKNTLCPRSMINFEVILSDVLFDVTGSVGRRGCWRDLINPNIVR